MEENSYMFGWQVLFELSRIDLWMLVKDKHNQTKICYYSVSPAKQA